MRSLEYCWVIFQIEVVDTPFIGLHSGQGEVDQADVLTTRGYFESLSSATNVHSRYLDRSGKEVWASCQWTKMLRCCFRPNNSPRAVKLSRINFIPANLSQRVPDSECLLVQGQPT